MAVRYAWEFRCIRGYYGIGGRGRFHYNNTNINTSDNVYGAVIMARPLREFTRFI